MPEKLTALMAAWEFWVSHPDDPNAEREFRGLVHRIAGSAGAFGYNALGERARAIDETMLRWADRIDEEARPLHELLSKIQERVLPFFQHFSASIGP